VGGGEKGREHPGHAVVGVAYPDQPAAAAQGKGGSLVAKPGRVALEVGGAKLDGAERIGGIVDDGARQRFRAFPHQAAVRPVNEDGGDLGVRPPDKGIRAGAGDFHGVRGGRLFLLQPEKSGEPGLDVEADLAQHPFADVLLGGEGGELGIEDVVAALDRARRRKNRRAGICASEGVNRADAKAGAGRELALAHRDAG